jgi:hypothetical protein
MPRFASREEYEAWKASGGAAPVMAAPGAVTAPLNEAALPKQPKKNQSLKEAFSGLPPWAWPFVVACFAIPVVTLGGALPTGIGFGAASGCAQVSKKADWETPARVLACAGIAAAAWILVFGLLAAIFAPR